MPAYNAAKTLEKTVMDIPQGFDDVILVDNKNAKLFESRISENYIKVGPKNFRQYYNQIYYYYKESLFDEIIKKPHVIVNKR